MYTQPLLLLTIIIATNANYNDEREKLIEYENNAALGSNIELNDNEIKVNDLLMRYKNKELQIGFQDPSKLLAAQHFFAAKEKIEESPVFQLIRRMPKGALLHSHDTAMASGEYLFNLTYWDGLQACIKGDDLILHFRPDNKTDCDWRLVQELRDATGDEFDEWIKSKLSLKAINVHSNANEVWSKFEGISTTISGLISYMPVFKAYFRQVLQELMEDNVMYLEFRDVLIHLYDSSDKTYDHSELISVYIDVLKDFKKDNPTFLNARLIYAHMRDVEVDEVWGYAEILLELKRKYPDFIAGFDLVGQEDLGKPLLDFVDALQNISLPTFYHAGETNWNGASTDLNLLDAILLGAKRIGHAYAIIKHPAVLKYVKENDVAIEVSPISNQVLKLVTDLRNHPANYLFANNYSVVVTNDDPSFWGARGLSYDWYYAFMTFTSWDAGLKSLKQLALNSLEYSAMGADEKVLAVKRFNEQWVEFIKNELGSKFKL